MEKGVGHDVKSGQRIGGAEFLWGLTGERGDGVTPVHKVVLDSSDLSSGCRAVEKISDFVVQAGVENDGRIRRIDVTVTIGKYVGVRRHDVGADR